MFDPESGSAPAIAGYGPAEVVPSGSPRRTDAAHAPCCARVPSPAPPCTTPRNRSRRAMGTHRSSPVPSAPGSGSRGAAPGRRAGRGAPAAGGVLPLLLLLCAVAPPACLAEDPKTTPGPRFAVVNQVGPRAAAGATRAREWSAQRRLGRASKLCGGSRRRRSSSPLRASTHSCLAPQPPGPLPPGGGGRGGARAAGADHRARGGLPPRKGALFKCLLLLGGGVRAASPCDWCRSTPTNPPVAPRPPCVPARPQSHTCNPPCLPQVVKSNWYGFLSWMGNMEGVVWKDVDDYDKVTMYDLVSQHDAPARLPRAGRWPSAVGGGRGQLQAL